MNFFKNNWLGIFLSSIGASLVAAYLYEHVSLEKVAAFMSALQATSHSVPSVAPTAIAPNNSSVKPTKTIGLEVLSGFATGSFLDDQDKRTAVAATLQALETGTTATWQNQDSGHSGAVTILRTYHMRVPPYWLCREYQQAATSGKTMNAYGTACQQANGFWQFVS